MSKRQIAFYICSLFLVLGWKAQAQNETSFELKTGPQIEIKTIAELGFLSVLQHKIKLGRNGTYFDYREDGGQDVVFPFSRFSLEMTSGGRNTYVFLYQPLALESEVILEEDAVFNDITFEDSTAVKFLYGFPFYRISYLREVMPSNPRWSLELGGSLQLRNATINVQSLDGSQITTNRNIGPVPAFKLRTSVLLNSTFYAGIEADGMYAPVSYLNGSDNEVVGAIIDANLRLGTHSDKPFNFFFNMRYLGGGAVGESDDAEFPSDGFTKNWLGFLIPSVGGVYGF